MKISKIDKPTKENFDLVDGNLNITTMVLGKIYPKVMTYEISMNVYNTDLLTLLLSDPFVRLPFMQVIYDETLFSKIIIANNAIKNDQLFMDNGGMAQSTFFDSITTLLKAEKNIRHSNDLSLAIGLVLSPFFKNTGSFKIQEELKKYTTEDEKFLTYNKLREIMVRQKVSQVLSMIRFDDVRNLSNGKTINVNVLASYMSKEITSAFRHLIDISGIDNQINTTLNLIKGKIINDYSNFDADELAIMDSSGITEMSSNYSLISLALSQTDTRPTSAYYFWEDHVKSVLDAIKSDSIYDITDFKSIETYFNQDVVYDKNTVRKVVIISENQEEKIPYAPFNVLIRRPGYTRTSFSNTADQIISRWFHRAQQVKSSFLHETCHAFVRQQTLTDTELHMISDVSDSLMLEMLAISQASNVRLAKLENGEYQFIYENSLDDKGIIAEIPHLYRTNYTSDPELSLIISAVDLKGTNTFSIDDSLFGDEDARFDYNGQLVCGCYKTGIKLDFNIPKGRGSYEKVSLNNVKLHEILQYESFQDLQNVAPTIGKVLIKKLITLDTTITNIEKSLTAGFTFGNSADQIGYDLNFKTGIYTKILAALELLVDDPIIATIERGILNKLWNSQAVVSNGSDFSMNPIQSKLSKRQIKLQAVKLMLVSTGYLAKADVQIFDDLIKEIVTSTVIFDV